MGLCVLFRHPFSASLGVCTKCETFAASFGIFARRRLVAICWSNCANATRLGVRAVELAAGATPDEEGPGEDLRAVRALLTVSAGGGAVLRSRFALFLGSSLSWAWAWAREGQTEWREQVRQGIRQAHHQEFAGATLRHVLLVQVSFAHVYPDLGTT